MMTGDDNINNTIKCGNKPAAQLAHFKASAVRIHTVETVIEHINATKCHIGFDKTAYDFFF